MINYQCEMMDSTASSAVGDELLIDQLLAYQHNSSVKTRQRSSLRLTLLRLTRTAARIHKFCSTLVTHVFTKLAAKPLCGMFSSGSTLQVSTKEIIPLNWLMLSRLSQHTLVVNRNCVLHGSKSTATAP